MRIKRAILVALTAFSVAILPVAVAGADPSLPPSVSEDCPHGQHCEKHSKGDCAKDTACALKCASVSTAPLAAFGIARMPSPLPKLAFVAAISASLSPNPPSPPPRI